MRDTDLLQLALGIMPPWLVDAATFDAERLSVRALLVPAMRGRLNFNNPFNNRQPRH